MKHIGFTGTRHGMTATQATRVRAVLAEIIDNDCDMDIVVHHGDCWGADEQFHEIARDVGCGVVTHPSTHNLRAYCKADKEMERRPPLDRNRDIVDASNVMIAAPAEMEEQQRGGTWSTIRYARRAGKRLVVVYPDGTTKETP